MSIDFTKSKKLYETACKVIPEGVSSPGRKFAEVETPPIFIERAQDAYIYDADGNEYIDFVNGLGPVLLGHAHPDITAAIEKAAKDGAIYGLSSHYEIELAEKIVAACDGMDQIRFVCSGSEATMSAIRLAKQYSGRNKILKFNGSYHGHTDTVLGVSIKTSAAQIQGVDKYVHDNTLICDYNDADELAEILKQHASDIAAVIIEPYASNMGVVKPDVSFIKATRALCNEHNVLLIFDEVVSGFRKRFGSVAPDFDVIPDMVVFGKIIGGGTPIGAYGASKAVMKGIEEDDFFQGGTFAANPVTMAAGCATMALLEDGKVYEHINQLGDSLTTQLNEFFATTNLGYHADNVGSLVSILLAPGLTQMKNLDDNSKLDRELFSQLYSYLLERGIMVAPTIDEPFFISAAHTQAHIDKFVDAVAGFFKATKI